MLGRGRRRHQDQGGAVSVVRGRRGPPQKNVRRRILGSREERPRCFYRFDRDEDEEESEVLAFVKCFELSAEDDDDVSVSEDGLVDVGELLWKLLLWPGAEEEHRSLAAGRSLRQDLLTHAEALGLETVGICALYWSRMRRGQAGSVEKLEVLKIRSRAATFPISTCICGTSPMTRAWLWRSCCSILRLDHGAASGRRG